MSSCHWAHVAIVSAISISIDTVDAFTSPPSDIMSMQLLPCTVLTSVMHVAALGDVEHVRAAQQGRGEDATSWWHTSYTDRYVQRLRSLLETDGESPEDVDDEYTWDRNP